MPVKRLQSGSKTGMTLQTIRMSLGNMSFVKKKGQEIMQKRPADVDIQQSIKDLFFTPNKFRLDDRFVIRDGKTHPFAILVPGGGYTVVCSFSEGVPVAKKLNQQGISAFIVYYRTRKKAAFPAPMEDLATAVRYVLDNAEKYHLDVNNYSVWGGSAGGHLTALFGTETVGYAKYNLPKPGALVLAYPVITMEREKTHSISHDNLLGKDADAEMEALTSAERQVTKNYPRTFIWCSEDDDVVDPDNTRRMAEALKKAGVPSVCKVYQGVAHGAGPATGTAAEGWMEEAASFWLNS